MGEGEGEGAPRASAALRARRPRSRIAFQLAFSVYGPSQVFVDFGFDAFKRLDSLARHREGSGAEDEVVRSGDFEGALQAGGYGVERGG